MQIFSVLLQSLVILLVCLAVPINYTPEQLSRLEHDRLAAIQLCSYAQQKGKDSGRLQELDSTDTNKIYMAASGGDPKSLKTLFTKGLKAHSWEANNALMVAAVYGHVQVVDFLLAQGVPANTKTEEGETALMWVAGLRHPDYFQIMKLLLNKGAEINARDKNGSTALTFAVESGNLEAIQLLLARGANRQGMNTRLKRVIAIEDPYHVEADPYIQWRPDHKLILCRISKPGGAAGEYTFGQGFYFVEIDSQTGNKKPLLSLNKHFPANKSQMIGYWCLSPDGNWLFWPEQATWFAARLDTTQIVRWPQPAGDATCLGFPYYAWTPDSQRWVAVIQRGNHLDAAIGSLKSPNVVQEIGYIHAIKSYAGYPGHSMLGVTPANKAIAAIWESGQTKHILLIEFSIDKPKADTREIIVPLPKGKFVRDLALSRQGDRLGWVLTSSTVDPLNELWVSDVEGKHFRKLADLSTGPLIGMADENHPQFLAWMPGDKNLSFLYKDAVWMINTE